MKAMGITACKRADVTVHAEGFGVSGTANASASVGCEAVLGNFSNTVNAQKQISCFIKETIQNTTVETKAFNYAKVTVGKGAECCMKCKDVVYIRRYNDDGNLLEEIPVECDCVGIDVNQTNEVSVNVTSAFTLSDAKNIKKSLAVAIKDDFDNMQETVQIGIAPPPSGAKAMNVASKVNDTLQSDNSLDSSIMNTLLSTSAENTAEITIGEGVRMYGSCMILNQENLIDVTVSSIMSSVFDVVSGIDGVTDLGTAITNVQKGTVINKPSGGLWMFLLLAPIIFPFASFLVGGKSAKWVRLFSFLVPAVGWFLVGALIEKIVESDNVLVWTLNSMMDIFGLKPKILSYVLYAIGGLYAAAGIGLFILAWMGEKRDRKNLEEFRYRENENLDVDKRISPMGRPDDNSRGAGRERIRAFERGETENREFYNEDIKETENRIREYEEGGGRDRGEDRRGDRGREVVRQEHNDIGRNDDYNRRLHFGYGGREGPDKVKSEHLDLMRQDRPLELHD